MLSSLLIVGFFYQNEKLNDRTVAFTSAMILAAMLTGVAHWLSGRSKKSSDARRRLRMVAGSIGAFFGLSLIAGILRSASASTLSITGGAAVGILIVWLGRPRYAWSSVPNPLTTTLLALACGLGAFIAVSVGLQHQVVTAPILGVALEVVVLMLWIVTLVGFAVLGDGPTTSPSLTSG